jgi:hypothetical protein
MGHIFPKGCSSADAAFAWKPERWRPSIPGFVRRARAVGGFYFGEMEIAGRTRPLVAALQEAGERRLGIRESWVGLHHI